MEKEYSFTSKRYAEIIFEKNLQKIDKKILNNYQKILCFLEKIAEYNSKKEFLLLLIVIVIDFMIIKSLGLRNFFDAIFPFILFFLAECGVVAILLNEAIPSLVKIEENDLLSLEILKNQKDILIDLNANNDLTNYEKGDIKSYLKEHRYEKDYGYQKLVEKESLLKIKEKIEQTKEMEDFFK